MLEYLAWMISTGEGGYIGRYWLNPVPAHMEGHRFAAWATRAEARLDVDTLALHDAEPEPAAYASGGGADAGVCATTAANGTSSEVHIRSSLSCPP